MKQAEFNFTEIVHTKENNRFSEGILEAQYERLANNCRVLYDALLRNEKLTGLIVIQRYGMIEYRRRFADLRQAGMDIKENTLKGGVKCWYIGEQLTNDELNLIINI